MLKKILKRDLSRNRLIMTILFVFIMIGAMLTSSAVSLILELLGAQDVLFEKSVAPPTFRCMPGNWIRMPLILFQMRQIS